MNLEYEIGDLVILKPTIKNVILRDMKVSNVIHYDDGWKTKDDWNSTYINYLEGAGLDAAEWAQLLGPT